MTQPLTSLVAAIIFLFNFTATTQAQAQAPKCFNYQSKVVDGLGNLVHDREVGINIRIFNSDSVIYEEEMIDVLSSYGQVSLLVGKGTVVKGEFNDIDWSDGQYFIESSIDLDNGSNYTSSRKTSLNSLPYALHANTTGGVSVKTEKERDEITNPTSGQVIFCGNCGEFGQFQVFNGNNWTDAIGNSPLGPILIQSLGVIIKDISDLDSTIEQKTLPLTLDIVPLNASNKTATWSSSDESIAEIDVNGIVSVIGEGEVTITAIANDGGGASGSLQLKFEDTRPPDLDANGLVVIGDTIAFINEKRNYFALQTPFLEIDSTIIWSSSDTSVLKINEDGVATVISVGLVKIIATTTSAPFLSDTLDIMVPSLVVDVEFPVITIKGFDGLNPVKIQRGTSNMLPDATVEDNLDSNVVVSVSLDSSFNAGPFNDTTLEDYRIIYRAIDSAGNESIDTILLSVVDTIAPIIIFENNLSNGDTLYSDNTQSFQLPNAFALDDNGDTIGVEIMVGDFAEDKAGFFTVFYKSLDESGNEALDSLYVLNADSIAPTIVLSGNLSDGDTITVPQGVFYSFPTATATDENGSVLSVAFDNGGFDSLEMGYYTFKYFAVDESKNSTLIEVTIYVIDNQPPIITNKIPLQLISASFGPGEEQVIAKIEATDNVGIASYEFFDLTTIGIYLGENWQGSVAVDNDGVVTLGNPNGDAFEANFFFAAVVTDSVGLTDTTICEFIYSLGKIRDIRVKQYSTSDWVQLGRPYSDPVPFSYELKEESKVGDTILFLTAGGNAFTSFEEIVFDETDPGTGSEDFEIQSSEDNYYLVLLNPLNNEVIPVYNLNFKVKTRNTSDTSLTAEIPLSINISIESVRELSPALEELYPAATFGQNLIVDDFLNPVADIINGVACPLSSANGILGDLAEGLDQAIGVLPIIPQDTAKAIAKRLMDVLPGYFWLAKDGAKTRINMKIPVKAKTLRIEYVIDPEKNGCYWGGLLEGLKPSSIDNSLSAFDNNTKAGVVVTTIDVTEKDFKCITLPCLKVGSGAHFVAFGNPVKKSGGDVAQGILDPTVFAVVTPLSAGYSDPELKVTLGLKADFRTSFNKEMVQRLDLAAAATKKSLDLARKGAEQASKLADQALNSVGLDTRLLDDLDKKIAKFASPVSFFQDKVSVFNSEVLSIASDIANTLLEDQLCTPGICLVPCFTPGMCSRDCGLFTCSFPCLRSCGCELRAPQLCIPNPIAELAAATIGRDKLRPAQHFLTHYTSALDRAQKKLSEVSSPRQAFQFALDQSTQALNEANSALQTATQQVSNVVSEAGPLGDVAQYLLDNAINQTVATGEAVLVTTLASANTGTYSGELTVKMRILSSPNLTIKFPQFTLTGDAIQNSLENAVSIILDQID